MIVFNEWHCANTSKKIRAVLEANAKSGKYMSSVPAYGYLKGDDEKCTPVIDPEAAPVVLRMFQMRAKGYSCKKISEVLNDEHILIPSDLIYKRLGKPNPRRTEHLWSDNVVRRILANRIYIGDLAQCKSTSVSYKNHKKIYHDEADWIIIENDYEPMFRKNFRTRCVSMRDLTAEASVPKQVSLSHSQVFAIAAPVVQR